MIFYTRLNGKVIDDKVSKNGKRYLKFYDGNNLLNVFVNGNSNYKVGDEVEIDCILYTKDAYIREYV